MKEQLMRQVITTVCELVGFVAITAGVALVSIPAGLIVAGLALLAIGIAGGRG